MEVLVNRDLILDVLNYDVTLVATSTKNAMGNGFQRKVAINFPYVYRSNNETKYDDDSKLGTIRLVNRGNDDDKIPKDIRPSFILCYITKGRFRPDKKPDTVDYDALKSCLELVNKYFSDKKIATTILGNSPYEGGGDRERIIKLMEECLKDCKDVTIYDYEQIDYTKEDNEKYWGLYNNRKNYSREEYGELRKKYMWERKYGIYAPIPDITFKEMKKFYGR